VSNSTAELTKKDIARENAKRYVADKAYLYVLGKSQSAKIGQIIKAVAVDHVDMRLMRAVMVDSDRFECVDRRWSPSARVGDSHRPFERVLTGLIQSAGVPVDVATLAQELAQVYNRPAEFYEQALPRVLSDTEKFFAAGSGAYGISSWLVIPTAESEEDVVFDNFLSQDQVDDYTAKCPAAEWTPGDYGKTAVATVKAAKEAVPMRILALFAWRSMGEDFDPVEFYQAILAEDDLLVLSDQNVYHCSALKEWDKTLVKLAEEVAALPLEADEEEAEGPVTVTETDKEEIISMILARGSASAEELLEAVLEVSSGEASFAGALESLNEALKDDERIMFIGGNRWSKVVVFPEEVKSIPESLVVGPVSVFETPEGDIYDQELEEEGFEGDLKGGIYDPLAEDVTDEDPARTIYQPNGDSQRCVLKYHHKTEGTFPLCQISPDFFGAEPEIIPIVLIDEGKRKDVFVNNSTRLMYGMKDLYKDITEISGAVFHIERTAVPGEFRFRFDGEIDDDLGIDTSRSLELLDTKSRYESQEMPLYDVIVETLQRQSMTFRQLVTQVNIVRRCSRLVVASILSSYHCFHTRGKSDQWLYDEKKRSQGFNKTKRKYVKK